jgi:hypothetical protein
MRYGEAVHWNAVLISCGHRAKVSPRESWPSLAVCSNHLLRPAGRDGHAALCTPIKVGGVLELESAIRCKLAALGAKAPKANHPTKWQR